jgi:hypothetical protein
MADCLSGTGKGGYPFKYDGRLQYTTRQWYNLYLSSDDQRYLRGVSVAGYTGFGGHVYLMVTRFSNLARGNPLPRGAAEFVLGKSIKSNQSNMFISHTNLPRYKGLNNRVNSEVQRTISKMVNSSWDH